MSWASFRTTSAGATVADSDQQQSKEVGEEEWGVMAGGKQKWTLLQNEQTIQKSTELS